MESILPYLLWGGLLVLMLRFGCGSHLLGHRHGKHGHDKAGSDGAVHGHGCCGGGPATDEIPPPRGARQNSPHKPATRRDPVCGMSVDADAATTMVHAGKVHYFCSRDCREIFETSPATYLDGADLGRKPGQSSVPSIPPRPRADPVHSTDR